ncbi:xanthine dehydrogenase family protein molybdopterin-binding subunit [Nocardioides sp. LHG3406-4]|uniref:xanthine dehydrogenase family protein molybdopterin-binding subunit n=1 Tax=Nocardioides sp. LHG3406-4 TaxID=2804575 RepID=UPI003CEA26CE
MSVDIAPPAAGPDLRSSAAGIGASVPRPDGDLKVRGRFAFSSDLWVEGMLWGVTVRSPHPHARILGIDIARAQAMEGVRAVLRADDIPGANSFGLIVPDQPVLADDVVRFEGEAVALVAADTPEQARRAAAAVDVSYEPLPVVHRVRDALAGDVLVHPQGNVVRDLRIRRGERELSAPVVVRGEYQIGMQDQAPLGTESGLAQCLPDGGVELFANTQWLHADRNQLASVLALPPSQIQVRLAGIGGAFGAREDLSLQAHLCLLALRTGRPVKMVYSREESFYGHVHRHPGVLRYEHGADLDGRLRYVRCSIELDGGAYASTSAPVVSNTAAFAVGPYACPTVDIQATVVYTNNPPCGAMRGFGAVQAAIGHEAQMDRLARELGMDPLELRLLNVLDDDGLMPTGQRVPGPVPARRLLEELRDLPMPPERDSHDSGSERPGGAGNVTRGESVVRGVGYGIGFKAGGMPEGVRDFSTARVRVSRLAEGVVAEVKTAASEVGQGLVTVVAQIVRTELGIDDVLVLGADSTVGSAGSSSASRQTYMTGGAVKAACDAVRLELLELAHDRLGHRFPELLEFGHGVSFEEGALVDEHAERLCSLAELLEDTVVEEERRFEHQPTTGLDADGQGDPHVQFIFAAHRAVADVDRESGLSRLVELAVAQDVGRAINPQAVEGQMEGGSAQGIGLAMMEEMQLSEGRLLNPSFTDYLIPTVLDVPPMRLKILEFPDPAAPYGIKGAGEPATISSTPAVVAALREASGRELVRVPVRPWDLVPELSEAPPLAGSSPHPRDNERA